MNFERTSSAVVKSNAPAFKSWIESFGTNVAGLVIGAVTGVLVARILGPEARGVLAEVLFWGGLVASLGLCSLPSALTHGVARAAKDRALPANAICLVLVLAIGTAMAFSALAPFILESDVRWLVLVFVLSFVPVNFLGQTLASIDRGRQNFSRFNRLRLIPQVTYFLLLLVLWAAGIADVRNLVVANWLGAFALVLARLRPMLRETQWQIGFSKLLSLTKASLRFHSSALVGILFQHADRLAIIVLFGSADLGYYAVAMTFAGAGLGAISQATNVILLPKLATTFSPADRSRKLGTALGANFSIALAMNLILAVLALWAIPFLFGADFAPATAVAVILCLAQIPRGFISVAIIGLRAIDDWQAGPLCHAVGLIAFAVGCSIVGADLGISGIAGALLCANAAAMAWMIYRVWRKIGLSPSTCLVPPREFVHEAAGHVRSRIRSRTGRNESNG
jgi:O-antigen/teichoic acid export membrane protein